MRSRIDEGNSGRYRFSAVLGLTASALLAYRFLLPPVTAADSSQLSIFGQLIRRKAVAPGGRPVTRAAGLVAFPLLASSDHRYLQDQSGQPFPILGRAAWDMAKLSVSDYQTFLDDTAAKGFNAVEFEAIYCDLRSNNRPYSGNGQLPFTKRLDGGAWTGSFSYTNINVEAPNFTQPNETYWTHIDGILSYAASKGILCLLFPSYVGYQGSLDEGWMQIMVANGTTKMTSYGAWVANRYKTYSNIVWMLGGDYGTSPNPFTAPQLAVEQALLSGMKSVPGQQSTQFSGLWVGPSIYTTQTDPTLRAAGTLQGAYSGERVPQWYRNAYAATPTMPALLVEEPYDEEGPDGTNVNANATQPCRRYQWWGFLCTIGGYVAGNGYIWTFNMTGYGSPWTGHLSSQTTLDNARLNAFIKSIPWQTLIPSGLGGMGTLITAGGSTPDATDYVAAAANPAGTLLVAYVPPAHTGTITVDMTKMSSAARARWFNPTTAVYTLISSSISNSGTHTFTPPGDNGTGYDDWVLVLDPAGSTGFSELTPCRLVDTRWPTGPLGGPALDANVGRTFAVANVCGVPPTARALAISVTAVAPSTDGFYRLFAADVPEPVIISLNFKAGQERMNNSVLLLSGDGQGRFTVMPILSSGTSHLVVDVNGYFQ